MKTHQPILLILIATALVLLLFVPVRTTAGNVRFYGLTSRPIATDLWRMDVPGGQFETIDDLFGETRIVTDVCLDTREDLLCRSI